MSIAIRLGSTKVAYAVRFSEQNPIFILYQTGSTNRGWNAKNVRVRVTGSTNRGWNSWNVGARVPFPVCCPKQEIPN